VGGVKRHQVSRSEREEARGGKGDIRWAKFLNGRLQLPEYPLLDPHVRGKKEHIQITSG